MAIRSFLKKAVKKALGRDEASAGAKKSSGSLPTGAVAFSDALKVGRSREVVVDGVGVAIFRTERGLLAVDNACTHEDGPLGEGSLSGDVVTCPYHDWRFDLNTGECLSHPDRHVGCWHVEERDGAIFVTGRRTQGSAERGGAHDDGMAVITKNLDEEEG